MSSRTKSYLSVGLLIVSAAGASLAMQAPCFAQSAVQSISTREASRASGLTGQPMITPSPSAINQSAWPLPNGGSDWGVLGTPVSVPYVSVPVGQTFDAQGITQTPQIPPMYTVDRQGNMIYTSPDTGLSETYGTNIQQLK